MITYPTASPSDISAGLANRAFNGTSFSPEKRGASFRERYAEAFNAFVANHTKREPQDGTMQDLADFLAGTKERYRQACAAYLHAHERVMSPMITGPARFPVRSNSKRCDTADRRLAEADEVLSRAAKQIQRKFFPLDAGISSDRDDAAELLAQKLAGLESLQAKMKQINAAHRAFKKNPASLGKNTKLTDQEKATIRNYEPQYSWEPNPFPPYALSNNNANIRRVRQRLAEVEARAKDQTSEQDIGDIKLVDNVDANRLQIFFPDKPDADTRTQLKRNGFRWSPKNGCWQRMRGNNATYAARSILGAAA